MKFKLLLHYYFLGLFTLNAQTQYPIGTIEERLELLAKVNKNNNPLQERSTYGVLDSIYGGVFWNGEWKDEVRTHFGYDNNLRVVDSSIFNSNWSQDLPTLWETAVKHNYTYDSEGKLIMKIRSVFNPSSGQFEYYLFQEYLYDDENRLVQENSSTTQAGLSQPGSKLIFVYDASGNNTNELRYAHTGSNNYLLIKNDTITYYPDGKLQTKVIRNVENNTLVVAFRYSYTYNGEGLLSLVFGEGWDMDEEAWFNGGKEFYYYEAGETQPIQELTQFYDEDEWIDVNRYDFYYSEPSAVRPDPVKNNMDCMVSNPYIPGSLINCEAGVLDDMTMSLTDLLGREVVRQSLNAPLETGNLPAGYYLLKIADKQGGGRHFQKLVFVANQ